MDGLRILLVEDEAGLVLTLTDLLRAAGYAVTHAGDYPEARAAVARGGFDAIVLDLMLPGGSGLDLLAELRSRGDDRPVLVLTARASVPERVAGLRLGADDYLGKPFDSEELLARIEAITRRPRHSDRPDDDEANRGRPKETSRRFGDIEVDEGRTEVRKAGRVLPLTVQEYRLLLFLIERAGKTVTRERLLEEVWGYGSNVASRTVDVHVSSLRQKLGDDPASPSWIITVRGRGYRFEL